MEQWLPPENMTGKMLHFDFRPGGSYRMRLTYKGSHAGRGKTSDDSDEVEVRWVSLELGQHIVQEAGFEYASHHCAPVVEAYPWDTAGVSGAEPAKHWGHSKMYAAAGSVATGRRS
jgi:hypothetical protein